MKIEESSGEIKLRGITLVQDYKKGLKKSIEKIN